MRIPKRLSPGRWQLAISDLSDTAKRLVGGQVSMAITEFRVTAAKPGKKKGAKKRKAPARGRKGKVAPLPAAPAG